MDIVKKVARVYSDLQKDTARAYRKEYYGKNKEDLLRKKKMYLTLNKDKQRIYRAKQKIKNKGKHECQACGFEGVHSNTLVYHNETAKHKARMLAKEEPNAVADGVIHNANEFKYECKLCKYYSSLKSGKHYHEKGQRHKAKLNESMKYWERVVRAEGFCQLL